jgi:hypothetical protein
MGYIVCIKNYMALFLFKKVKKEAISENEISETYTRQAARTPSG